MVSCEKCGKTFRCEYYLTRHMSRLRPCVQKNSQEKNENPNFNTLEPNFNTENPKITTLEPKNLEHFSFLIDLF